MSEREDSDFEARLRRALRPVEPPSRLETRVAAALAREAAGAPADARAGGGLRRWIPVARPLQALAAAVAAAVTVAGAMLWSAHRSETDRARRAGQQISIALSLASTELDGALTLANRLSESEDDPHASIETNTPGSRAARGPESNSHD